MRKHIVIFFIILVWMGAAAQSIPVRWHNELTDTTRITEMLKGAAKQKFSNPSECVAWFGDQFIGTPYVAHTLEGDEEMVTINLDGIDCTTFVELALALAYTAGEQRQGWPDLVFNLRRFRYRGGENVDGYASRLHYICDWALDNSHRGNIDDITRDIPRARYLIRTIDFMTSNREKYPAMADSAQFARIKSVEGAYHNHRFPYIKTSDIASKDVQSCLRNGDVVAFVSNLKNLDVTHMGIIVKADDGEFHVLHASSVNGKVEVSALPLAQFVKRNPHWIGIRVFRLKE